MLGLSCLSCVFNVKSCLFTLVCFTSSLRIFLSICCLSVSFFNCFCAYAFVYVDFCSICHCVVLCIVFRFCLFSVCSFLCVYILSCVYECVYCFCVVYCL